MVYLDEPWILRLIPTKPTNQQLSGLEGCPSGLGSIEKRFNCQAVSRKHVYTRDTKELHLISEGQEGLLFIQRNSNIYPQ